MKKFSKFVNEGAVNSQKATYTDDFQIVKSNQQVNESVILGALLIFGFCALADPEMRKNASEKIGKAKQGLFSTILGGAGLWGVLKAKKDAKKEEKDALEKEKLNRLFLQCKKTLKETPKDQQNSQEFKDAQAYMDAYTMAKYDKDGNEVKDPTEINKRLKTFINPDVYDRVIKKANKAATDNTTEEILLGVAKKASEMTPEEYKLEMIKERETSINQQLEKSQNELNQLETERDAKIKEAQEKGDDTLVQSIKDEYETKIKKLNDNINEIKTTQQNIQKEKETQIQKNLLVQQEKDLETAKKNKLDLEAQKAKELSAAEDDKEKKSIEKDYEKKLKDADTKIVDAQKKVDSTKESIAKLSTSIKPIEEPKKPDEKPQEVKDAEKTIEELENEKKEALLKETDEEKKKQIEKEYDEKIKAAQNKVNDAKTKALEKTGEEDKIEFKDDDGNIYTKDGDKYKMKDSDGEEIDINKEDFESEYKKYTQKDEEDDAKDDDERVDNDDDLEKPEFSTSGGKVTYDEKGKDPRKFWKKRTYKRGDKTFKTKSYYNKHGVSISAEEFNNKIKNFEKKQKKTKNESLVEYLKECLK